MLVLSQFTKRAASFQVIDCGRLVGAAGSLVKKRPPSVLALSIISSEISYLPIRNVLATEPAGFGLPVVSAALPGLPIGTNSMLNVFAPLPKVNVPPTARPAEEMQTKCC